jgi:hypothetical protein
LKSRGLLALGLIAVQIAGSAGAAPSTQYPDKPGPGKPALEQLARDTALRLSTLCPPAAADDVAAHEKCAAGLRDASFIPWVPAGLLFGGEQPTLPLSKWRLTHFKPGIWELMYLSLFTFTGHWSIDEDPREHIAIIHIEAYFRNAMPPGEFPYPFWHSADKWNSYETANELKFWLDKDGQVFMVTRSIGGTEAGRGPRPRVAPPAFDGKWQWTDASGHTQPRASLFASKYNAANPYLEPLNDAYRKFAIEARNGSCLECHAPTNKAGMDHLVLLQTPLHAAGEIDRVLKEVANGEMPEDEIGLRKEIDPALRAAILQTGEQFRRALIQADQWEAKQQRAGKRDERDVGAR